MSVPPMGILFNIIMLTYIAAGWVTALWYRRDIMKSNAIEIEKQIGYPNPTLNWISFLFVVVVAGFAWPLMNFEKKPKDGDVNE